MNQMIKFPHCQFQVIQFRPRKQIHLHPRKEYLVIQFRPRKQIPLASTEGVSCHSVPLTEEDPLTSTEERSQMNCASISDTADSSDSSSVRVVGSNNHSLSITDLPSHTGKS